jgi:hypothetical protein
MNIGRPTQERKPIARKVFEPIDRARHPLDGPFAMAA